MGILLQVFKKQLPKLNLKPYFLMHKIPLYSFFKTLNSVHLRTACLALDYWMHR